MHQAKARPVATKTLADVRMLRAGHVVAQTQSARRGVPRNCNAGVAWNEPDLLVFAGAIEDDLRCPHFVTKVHEPRFGKPRVGLRTALIEGRREQHRQRTGHELTDDNVWIRKRLRELNSLDATRARLAAEEAPKSVIIAPPVEPMIPPRAKPTPAAIFDRYPSLAALAMPIRL